MKHKVWLYTLCYNEMPILPFMVDYWEKICEKAIVYDNGSTDGSREFLAKYPFIEVRDFHIGEKFNDKNNMDMKNTAWKEARGKADYVIVCDMDEVLWRKGGVEALLDEMDAKKQDISTPQGYEMVSEEFPEYREGELLHQQCFKGVPYAMESKSILFNPNTVAEMKYTPGAHTCYPKVSRGGVVKRRVRGGEVLLHYKKLGEEYLLDKYHFLNKRLSDENLKRHWGTQYLGKDADTIRKFKKDLSSAKDLRNLL